MDRWTLPTFWGVSPFAGGAVEGAGDTLWAAGSPHLSPLDARSTSLLPKLRHSEMSPDVAR